jgi:hypothetical protein
MQRSEFELRGEPWALVCAQLHNPEAERAALALRIMAERTAKAAMDANAGGEGMEGSACWALGSIARVAATLTQTVLDSGALPQLLATVHAHAGSAAVQHAACWVLRNIAAGSDTLPQAAVDAGALPQLVTALVAHARIAAVQLTACDALSNIAPYNSPAD